MEQEKLTYTIQETCKLLGIGKGKGYQLAHAGLLPVLKFGKRMVVPKYALEQMMKQAGRNTQQSQGDIW